MLGAELRRWGRPFGVVLSAGVLAAGVAACGSSSSGGSTSSGGGGGSSTQASGGGGNDAQAQAKAIVDKIKKVPEFTLDAKPVDASKAKGKTIFNIPVSSSIPYVAETDKQAQALAKQLGINWVQYNNQGNPTQWASGINQAISQHADEIILDAGNDPALVLPQLKRAKAAGIPVLVSHLYQNGESPTPATAPYIKAFITVPFHESGQYSVDYAVAQGGCDAIKSTLVITAKEVPPSNGIVGAIQDEMKKLCPDASAKVINVPVVDWGTKIAPEVQSALSADPNIKWVIPIYDSMAIPAQAAVRAAGKATSVKISSYNGTPDVLKLIQDGDIMAADMGENINWLAYATIDQSLRILTNTNIIESGLEATPLRLFDDSNVGETGTPPQPGAGFGKAYEAGYKKLWGIQ
jgi:ribose transport system substrate-binding protein